MTKHNKEHIRGIKLGLTYGGEAAKAAIITEHGK